VKLTLRPEDEVAAIVRGPGIVFAVRAAKVIVCELLEIETVFVAVPIAYGDNAGTSAVKIQDPADTPVITPVVALKVHAPVGFAT
jgi:hypothetical protein